MSDLPDTTLFPLPLVAFEQYMFTDDRPDYPASFFLRLGFAGIFDRPAFHSAVDTALRRHPLLRACVRASAKERLEWVSAERPGPLIRWKADQGPCTSVTAPRIDLRHETGLRIFLGQQQDRTEMLLQFHHACCDGFGAVQFVEDLLAAYHNSMAGSLQQIALPTLDAGRLRLRGKFGLSPLKYLLRAHKELAGALGVLEYFVLRPVPLLSRQGRSPAEVAGGQRPASFTHSFTPAETQQLRRATRHLGCTVNDLLLRDLFLALQEWIVQHDPESATGWCRIMIPTNLRLPADAVMPAANVVGMVFNDRRPRKFSSPRRLMNLLRTEMKFCKRWRLGLSMIHMLCLVRKFRGGLERVLPTDRCLATSVLSNLGHLAGGTRLPRRDGQIVAANVTLQRVELLPPLRPMTHASFGAVSYAGRLNLSLSYDPRYITPQDGRQLLRGFTQRIQTSLNSPD
jgi:hypothetical protein